MVTRADYPIRRIKGHRTNFKNRQPRPRKREGSCSADFSHITGAPLRCSAQFWHHTATIPKLFINADPGAILTGDQREYCRSWPHQEEITVPGVHYIQEDSAEEIGVAIASFVGAES